jgi:integrase
VPKKGEGLLLLEETVSQQKVIDFLNIIARNSQRSKDTYSLGLAHFQTFLHQRYGNERFTLENIIDKILNNEVNVYGLLDNFVSYLISLGRLSTATITLQVAATRSYLQYYDIDISPTKFKRRVKMPKNHREDEEPIDATDIRKILLSCQNRRLKPYLLVLASCGCRTLEALAIRCKDIDFSVNPTKIHIRKEFAKTRVGRDVYISDEATKFLKEWLEWKYRKREKQTPVMYGDDLVFSKAKFGNEQTQAVGKQANPIRLYTKIVMEFNSLLKVVKMDERKEGMLRRKVTLHSFRRFAKTVVSNEVNQDYSEWFLGHAKSPYWTMKEDQRREMYAAKCMKYLTFLDYSGLESTSKNIESKLEAKDREIAHLRQKDLTKEELIANLIDRVQDLTTKVDDLMEDKDKKV